VDARIAKRLLLIDSDGRALKLLGRMLREDGFVVELAFDGAAGIGRLTRDPLPDLLVTGLRIPYVDGLTVARYARSRDPRMPLCFMTRYPHQLSSGVDQFDPPPIVVTKPIDYGVFTAKLLEQLNTNAIAGG
jgi:CheY-like chemotaxis protein